MDVIDNDEVSLLLIRSEMAIIPVVPLAFQVTQASRKRLESYIGALVVDRSGAARRIQGIDVLGLWGDTFGRKLISALSGARRIKVHFIQECSLDLHEWKSLLVEYIRSDSERPDPYLPQNQPLGKVFENVEDAKSFEEVFGVINIPPPEDCLDVL